jgi:hypothetical protein
VKNEKVFARWHKGAVCSVSLFALALFTSAAYGDELGELSSRASLALKNQEYSQAENLALKALAISISPHAKAKSLYLLISIYSTRNEIEKMEPILRQYCVCLQSIHGVNSLEFASSLDFYAKALTKLSKNGEAAALRAKAREIRSRVSGSAATNTTTQQETNGRESRSAITASISVILKATPEEIATAKRVFKQWDWKHGTSYSKGSLPSRLTEPAYEIARRYSLESRDLVSELEDGKVFIETFEGMLFMAEDTVDVEVLGWSQGTFVHILPLRNRSHPFYEMSTDDNGIDDASKQVSVRLLHKL